MPHRYSPIDVTATKEGEVDATRLRSRGSLTLTSVSLRIAAASVFLVLGGGLGLRGTIAGATTPRCASSWLTAKVGPTGGAGGTSYFALEIVNHSTSSCTLSGTPVSLPGFVPKNGVHWASIGPQSSEISFAGRGKRVVIRPGKVASVELGISTTGNYAPSKCGPKAISGVEIVFSPATAPVYLEYKLSRQSVCTKLASTSIAGIVLGTHFP